MVDGKVSKQYIWLVSAHAIYLLQVQHFFTKMNEHDDFKDKFDHPDPEELEPKDPAKPDGEKKRKRVDWCRYWAVSQCRSATPRLTHFLIARPH